jgi:hypothetical protein
MSQKKRSASAASIEDSNSPAKKLKNDAPAAVEPLTDAPAVTPLPTVIAAPTSPAVDANEPANEPAVESSKAGSSARPIKKTKTKAVPIATLFDNATLPQVPVPKYNDAWGRKPLPGPEGPRSHPDQPSARGSDGQTIPALWEDRGHRYQRGNRFVKSFRKGASLAKDAPANHDQENLLSIKLIDMRPKSRKEPTPRRLPIVYSYEHGRPKDWDNKQAIKALNDRRQQAIDRITVDAAWTNEEREYLAYLFGKFPEASMLEITERFNHRFMDDFVTRTAFSGDRLSTGRTIESVRSEYLVSQESYNKGETPEKKELTDKSGEVKAAEKRMIEKFGAPDPELIEKFDKHEQEKKAKKLAKKAQKAKEALEKQSSISDAEEALEVREPYSPQVDIPVLSHEDEEELLKLAGFYSPERVRSSTSPPPSRSPIHQSEVQPAVITEVTEVVEVVETVETVEVNVETVAAAEEQEHLADINQQDTEHTEPTDVLQSIEPVEPSDIHEEPAMTQRVLDESYDDDEKL